MKSRKHEGQSRCRQAREVLCLGLLAVVTLALLLALQGCGAATRPGQRYQAQYSVAGCQVRCQYECPAPVQEPTSRPRGESRPEKEHGGAEDETQDADTPQVE